MPMTAADEAADLRRVVDPTAASPSASTVPSSQPIDEQAALTCNTAMEVWSTKPGTNAAIPAVAVAGRPAPEENPL